MVQYRIKRIELIDSNENNYIVLKEKKANFKVTKISNLNKN